MSTNRDDGKEMNSSLGKDTGVIGDEFIVYRQ
jgi:hypothetical protein